MNYSIDVSAELFTLTGNDAELMDMGILGSGGIEFSGIAPVENTIDITGTGGIEFSGIAPVENTIDITGSGGIAFTGTAGLGDYTVTKETEN